MTADQIAINGLAHAAAAATAEPATVNELAYGHFEVVIGAESLVIGGDALTEDDEAIYVWSTYVDGELTGSGVSETFAGAFNALTGWARSAKAV